MNINDPFEYRHCGDDEKHHHEKKHTSMPYCSKMCTCPMMQGCPMMQQYLKQSCYGMKLENKDMMSRGGEEDNIPYAQQYPYPVSNDYNEADYSASYFQPQDQQYANYPQFQYQGFQVFNEDEESSQQENL